jgi:hypothetical protein
MVCSGLMKALQRPQLWHLVLISGVALLLIMAAIVVAMGLRTSDGSAGSDAAAGSEVGLDGSSGPGVGTVAPDGASPSGSTSPGANPTAGPPSTGGSGGSSGGGSTEGSARTGCLAAADRCGYPTAATTGVPVGVALTLVNGDLHMNQAGKKYDALDIRGCVLVEADNVTLSRSKVDGRDCEYYVINNEVGDTPHTGLTITDVDVDLTGQFNTKGIASSQFTARRVHFHGGADCIHYGSNVIIEDNLCEVAKLPPNTNIDYHADGFQSGGGSGVLIQHNTILNANDQTSAIINGTDGVALDLQYNVRIINNLMAGGGYTVYCNAHYASVVPTTEIRGNRISRSYYTWPGNPARGGFYGPWTDCKSVSGAGTNVWDEDGAPIPPA